MKYNLCIITLVLIIVLFLIILRSKNIESFQNICSKDACKDPNVWINNFCHAPCPAESTPSEKTPLSCVYKGEDGNNLPFYTGVLRPVVTC
jgi:hypothetical protein